MSLTYKDILSSLLPDGAIWRPAPGLGLDKFLEGMGNNEERIREFLADLAHIRDPDKTPILSDLEKEYGIKTNLNVSEADRRDQLAGIMYARRANGSRDFLQDQLQRAGYPLQVHDNAPATDPEPLIFGQSQMYCGDPLAQCGEPLAQCAYFNGELLVNGNIGQNVVLYTVQCGETLAQCGEPTALAGNYSGVSVIPITYVIPDADYFFSETFWSEDAVVANGGTILGSPVIYRGGQFDQSGEKVDYTYAQLLSEMTCIVEADVTFLSGSYQYFVNSYGIDYRFFFGLGNEASTTAKTLVVGATGAGFLTSTVTVGPGRHQFAYTIDSSGNVNFYLDGSKVGATVPGFSFGSYSTSLNVGARQDFFRWANGTIYDVKLYDFELTQSEIQAYIKDQVLRWWSMIFFVGGDVVRDPVSNKIVGIEFVNIPIQNRAALRQLILKYKPLHSWAALAVNWT